MHTQKSACAHTIKHALLLSGSNTCAQKATSPFTVLLREPHQISTLHRTRETKHTHAHTYTHSHFAKRSNIHIATDSSCTSLKLSHVKKVVIVRDEQKTICVRAADTKGGHSAAIIPDENQILMKISTGVVGSVGCL